jgi:predicted ATPase with chaperone activity
MAAELAPTGQAMGIPIILPPLTLQEEIETTKLHSFVEDGRAQATC